MARDCRQRADRTGNTLRWCERSFPDQIRIVRICFYTAHVNPNAPTPPTPSAPAKAPASIPQVAFAELSSGRREVYIEHAGQVYRLSLTAQNKLILTK
jgi:hemin uptake protein HemP